MKNNIQIRTAQPADYTGVSSLLDQLHELHVQARPDIYKPLHPGSGKMNMPIGWRSMIVTSM